MHSTEPPAVEPPFRQPPAHVDWGRFYREIAACLDSEREFADVCDAVESVLCWSPHVGTPNPVTGERTLTVPLPAGGFTTVGYVTSSDPDGFIRCRIRRVWLSGAGLAA